MKKQEQLPLWPDLVETTNRVLDAAAEDAKNEADDDPMDEAPEDEEVNQ